MEAARAKQRAAQALHSSLSATSMSVTPTPRIGIFVGNTYSLDPCLLENSVWVIPKHTSAPLAPACCNTPAVYTVLIGAAQNPAIQGQAKEFSPVRSSKWLL